jgi:hypothetical protein
MRLSGSHQQPALLSFAEKLDEPPDRQARQVLKRKIRKPWRPLRLGG